MRWTRPSPTPERAVDQPFLMPIEDVFGIKGRGTVVTRADRAGPGAGRRDHRNPGHGSGRAVAGGDRGGDVPQDPGRRGKRATTWAVCCAGWSEDDVQRGQVLAAPGEHCGAGAVSGERVRVEPGRRGPAHAVLSGVPAAVLHPDDGRDGRD